MFESEWRLQQRTRPLHHLAIVDDAPSEQFLYPEFLIAQQMLVRAGIEAVVLDPGELQWDGVALRARGQEIDLVYNRLVDFTLAEDRHAALREAYRAGAVVVTPNPHVHALRADKRNLILLADSDWLREAGADAAIVTGLASIPKTIAVGADNADDLWRSRKQWFFKPATGYGSKAVYRGDKVTRSAWETVVAGSYVAQAYAEPGERVIDVDGAPATRKVDVRLYTYDGKVLLIAARMYQGQTTNLRTPGGGFAPVFVV